jgi:hypothetical protein
MSKETTTYMSKDGPTKETNRMYEEKQSKPQLLNILKRLMKYVVFTNNSINFKDSLYSI